MAEEKQAPTEVDILRSRLVRWRVFTILFVIAVLGGVGYWFWQMYGRMQQTEKLAAAQQRMIDELHKKGTAISAEQMTAEDLVKMLNQSNEQMTVLQKQERRLRDSIKTMMRQGSYSLGLHNHRGRWADVRPQLQTISRDSVQMTLRVSIPAAAKLADVGKVGYQAVNSDTRLKSEEISSSTPLNGYLITLDNLKSVDLLLIRYYKKPTGELLHEQVLPL